MQNRRATRSVRHLALVTASLGAASIANGQIVLSLDTPYVQPFNIGTSATASLPTAFKVDKRAAVRQVGTYAAAVSQTEQVEGAAVGASAANGIYNFGSGTTDTGTDRAVGFIASGSATQSGNVYGFFNLPANTNTLDLSFDVEKYRNGSNAAGFRFELYYSTNGTSWTTAGPAFTQTFAADANNNGFTSAPGVSSNVTGLFELPAPSVTASNFYLAFNYSVTSGSTTTNAQALGIDNLSIEARVTPEPTTALLFGLSGAALLNSRRRREGDQTSMLTTLMSHLLRRA